MKKNQIHKIGQQQQQQDKSTTNLIFFLEGGEREEKKCRNTNIFITSKVEEININYSHFCFICLNIK